LKLVFSAPEQCQRCARGDGCGAGVFARLFTRSETLLPVPPGAALADGDWVRVGLEPRRLAVAAAWHYGLPLAGFLLGAAVGHAALAAWTFRDPVALAAGLAGFVVATRLSAMLGQPSLNPVVERLSCKTGNTKS
jgi:sigma-E factor negative regulatory protein RseC